ncbi:MAG: LEPR-XLL domain-containing protein [Planctomycetaceae bacterium]
MFLYPLLNALSNVLNQPLITRHSNRRRFARQAGQPSSVATRLESLEDRVLLSADGFNYVAGSHGTGISEGAFETAVDSQGNTYALVDFDGIVDFDPGPNLFELQKAPHALIKLDPTGNFVWAKGLSNTHNADLYFARTLTVGDDGNVYVFQTGMTSNVVKFDGAGNHLEEFEIVNGFVGGISSRGVTVDSAGNIYLGGYFTGELEIGEGDDTVVYNSTSETPDGIVLKLDPSGNLEWVKQFAISGPRISQQVYDHYIGAKMVMGEDENLILVEEFTGSVDLEYETGGDIRNSNGESDILIAKLNSAGELVWGHTIGGSGYEDFEDVAVDDQGNIVISGAFSGIVDFDPSSNTEILETETSPGRYPPGAFLARFTPDGQLNWAGKIDPDNSSARLRGLDFDAQGNLIIAAYMIGVSDIDIGSGEFLVGEDYARSVIFSLDSDANILWVGQLNQYPRNLSEKGIFNVPLDVLTLNDGSITVSGFYDKHADFDIGPGEEVNYTYEFTRNSYIWNISASDIRGLAKQYFFQADFDFGLSSRFDYSNPATTSIVEVAGVISCSSIIPVTQD